MSEPLPQKVELLLRNGVILDGTGLPPYRGDIGITADRITALGDLSGVSGGVERDISGLHVAPGFIDIHTHSDISITYDPLQSSALAMGVTTQVTGNCGLSMGLVQNSSVFDMERRWLALHGARVRWSSFEEHFKQIQDTGIATNYLTLVGHGSVRKRVMGLSANAPTADELVRMQAEVATGMEAGAWGLSSGLEYPPASFANEEELVALCTTVGRYGGLYATHLRNEGDTLIEAVQEALNISERAGIPLQLSHHKAEGRENWGKVSQTLAMVDAARARGLDVQLDQYPYTAFMTALAVQTIPAWANAGSIEDVAKRLQDPETRARVLAEIRAKNPSWDSLEPGTHWHTVQIGICRGKPEYQGKTVAALAMSAGRSPLEFVIDLLSESHDFIAAVSFAIGEEDIVRVLQHPFTAIGSDGVGTNTNTVTRHEKIHPRTYGTFPRVFAKYVRELGVLREEQAVYKMTLLPATRLGLQGRGRLAIGAFADIVVYNPDTIGDVATFNEPHRYSTGVSLTLVNGRIAWEAGEATQNRSGSILRHRA